MEPARSHFALSKESMAFAARLDAAETALRREDFRAAGHLLHRAPSMLQGTGDGRVLELMALCASHSGQSPTHDPWQLWQRCLVAYQQDQDMRGAQRAHRALGLWAFGKGELEVASQELRRAQRLLERQQRPDACVLGLCQQAEVALARGRDHIEEAYRWADEAVVQCQIHEGWGLLDARARLLRARASCLLGSVGEAALDLLWAERASAPYLKHNGQNMGLEVLQVVMCRAETLLLLGHPRRAATCLAVIDATVRQTSHEDLLAYYHLLVSQALVGDLPHDAHASGLQARNFYSARKQSYLRAVSEIALLRTGLRLGRGDLQHRLRAITNMRPDRWPLVAVVLNRAKEELDAPHALALGAVKTPWTRAVGKVNVATSPTEDGRSDSQGAEHGFLTKLNHAIGRATGDDPYEARTSQSRN